MDTRTGDIKLLENVRKLSKKEQDFFIEMKTLATPEQLKRVPPRVGPNELCPCGSGKKFKKCHRV